MNIYIYIYAEKGDGEILTGFVDARYFCMGLPVQRQSAVDPWIHDVSVDFLRPLVGETTWYPVQLMYLIIKHF